MGAFAASAVRARSPVGIARLVGLSRMLIAGAVPLGACEQPPEMAFPSHEDDRPVPAAKHARGAYSLDGGAVLPPAPTELSESPEVDQDGGIPLGRSSPDAGAITSSDAGALSPLPEVSAKEPVAL